MRVFFVPVRLAVFLWYCCGCKALFVSNLASHGDKVGNYKLFFVVQLRYVGATEYFHFVVYLWLQRVCLHTYLPAVKRIRGGQFQGRA